MSHLLTELVRFRLFFPDFRVYIFMFRPRVGMDCVGVMMNEGWPTFVVTSLLHASILAYFECTACTALPRLCERSCMYSSV